MTVYQSADGQWWVSVEAGYTRTGGRRRVRRRVTSKKQGRLVEQDLLLAKRAGKLTVGKGITVMKWADQWLADQATRVRPKTWSGYQTMVRYARETIGSRPVEQLTPGDVRTFTAAIRKRGVTSTAVRDSQTRLFKMLRDARAEGIDVPDNALAVRLPARAVTDRSDIPRDDLQDILTAAATIPDGSRWVAAILQGMRQGECLGLTWGCVDLDLATIDVSWQLQEVRFAHGCDGTCSKKRGGSCPQRRHQVPDGYEYRPIRGAWCLVRPKTARGQRIIPMVPWLTAALREWKAVAPSSPHDLVWPQVDGEPRNPIADNQQWRALQDAAQVAHVDGMVGRRYDTHEARHSTATLLLEAGVDPQTVTAILGHSSIVTSRGYQHVSQALARQAMEAIAERLQLGVRPTAALAGTHDPT